jgi:hypothetical protein
MPGIVNALEEHSCPGPCVRLAPYGISSKLDRPIYRFRCGVGFTAASRAFAFPFSASFGNTVLTRTFAVSELAREPHRILSGLLHATVLPRTLLLKTPERVGYLPSLMPAPAPSQSRPRGPDAPDLNVVYTSIRDDLHRFFLRVRAKVYIRVFVYTFVDSTNSQTMWPISHCRLHNALHY